MDLYKISSTTHLGRDFRYALTSHGTESIHLLSVIVVSSAAPSHAISSPISGAVCVIATTVEEGEVAQSTIGVSANCCYNGWIEHERNALLLVTSAFLSFDRFTAWTQSYRSSQCRKSTACLSDSLNLLSTRAVRLSVHLMCRNSRSFP